MYLVPADRRLPIGVCVIRIAPRSDGELVITVSTTHDVEAHMDEHVVSVATAESTVRLVSDLIAHMQSYRRGELPDLPQQRRHGDAAEVISATSSRPPPLLLRLVPR